MNPEHLTNEELAGLVRDFREKMLNSGGRAWSLTIPAKETDPDIMLTEIESRLRNSIPKPVVEVKPTPFDNWMVVVNGEVVHVANKQYKANHPKCGECRLCEREADDALGGWCSYLEVPIYANFYCRHWEPKP